MRFDVLFSVASVYHLFHPVWVLLSPTLPDVHFGGVDAAWLWETAQDMTVWVTVVWARIVFDTIWCCFFYSEVEAQHQILYFLNFYEFFDFLPSLLPLISPQVDERPRTPSLGCQGSSSLPCLSFCRSYKQRKQLTNTAYRTETWGPIGLIQHSSALDIRRRLSLLNGCSLKNKRKLRSLGPDLSGVASGETKPLHNWHLLIGPLLHVDMWRLMISYMDLTPVKQEQMIDVVICFIVFSLTAEDKVSWLCDSYSFFVLTHANHQIAASQNNPGHMCFNPQENYC